MKPTSDGHGTVVPFAPKKRPGQCRAVGCALDADAVSARMFCSMCWQFVPAALRRLILALSQGTEQLTFVRAIRRAIEQIEMARPTCS